MVKFPVHSIRKRTREDLGKEREVTHTDVRRRERKGRICVPWIVEEEKEVFVANDTHAVESSFEAAASWTLAAHTGEKLFWRATAGLIPFQDAGTAP